MHTFRKVRHPSSNHVLQQTHACYTVDACCFTASNMHCCMLPKDVEQNHFWTKWRHPYLLCDHLKIPSSLNPSGESLVLDHCQVDVASLAAIMSTPTLSLNGTHALPTAVWVRALRRIPKEHDTNSAFSSSSVSRQQYRSLRCLSMSRCIGLSDVTPFRGIYDLDLSECTKVMQTWAQHILDLHRRCQVAI